MNGDPRLSHYYRILSLWPIYAGKGENQQKMTATQQKKLIKRAAEPMRSFSPIPSTTSSPAPSPTKVLASIKWLRRRSSDRKNNPPSSTPPQKKFKRLHDDRRLAMGMGEM